MPGSAETSHKTVLLSNVFNKKEKMQVCQYISTFRVVLLQKFSLVLKQPVSIGYVSCKYVLYETKWSETEIISYNQKL